MKWFRWRYECDECGRKQTLRTKQAAMRLIYWVCAQGIHVLGWIQDWAYERNDDVKHVPEEDC
jgi:hypothetical protein